MVTLQAGQGYALQRQDGTFLSIRGQGLLVEDSAPVHFEAFSVT